MAGVTASLPFFTKTAAELFSAREKVPSTSSYLTASDWFSMVSTAALDMNAKPEKAPRRMMVFTQVPGRSKEFETGLTSLVGFALSLKAHLFRIISSYRFETARRAARRH